MASPRRTGYWIEIQTHLSEAYFAIILTGLAQPVPLTIDRLLAHLVRHRRDDDHQRHVAAVVHRAIAAAEIMP